VHVRLVQGGRMLERETVARPVEKNGHLGTSPYKGRFAGFTQYPAAG